MIYTSNVPISMHIDRTKVLILIPSALGEFQKRQLARFNYSQCCKHIQASMKMVFYIGRAGNQTSRLADVRRLKMEMSMYQDVVWDEDFVDSYRNLTLKMLRAFRWVMSTFTSKLRYIVKWDIDVVVHIPRFLQSLIKAQNDILHKRPHLRKHLMLLYGMVSPFYKTSRNPLERSYVPPSLYKSDIMPTYLTGGVYAHSYASLSAVLANYSSGQYTMWGLNASNNATVDTRQPQSAAYRTSPYPCEDVFINGILLENVKYGESSDFYRIHDPNFCLTDEFMKDCLNKRKRTLVAVHGKGFGISPPFSCANILCLLEQL